MRKQIQTPSKLPPLEGTLTINQLVRNHVVDVLLTSTTKTQAALRLGINKRSLYRLIERYHASCHVCGEMTEDNPSHASNCKGTEGGLGAIQC